MAGEPQTIFGAEGGLFGERPRDNRFDPAQLAPTKRAYVIREEGGRRAWDVMAWDVLDGAVKPPMTNVRNLALARWRKLASDPARRCVVPLTAFCEWEGRPTDLGDGKPPIKAERWFSLPDQPVFAVAGFWQPGKEGPGFAMVTCDANELVAPIHPKAMITILEPGDVDRWLAGTYDDVLALQRPYPAERMVVGPPTFPTRGR